MTTSEVIYVGELSTEATHIRSGSTITTDAPVDNNGKGRTFSPTDLLATALASCMLTVMGIRAEDWGSDISGTKAEVIKTMAAEPRRVAQVDVFIKIKDRGLTDVQKKVLEKAARTCPVALSLNEHLKQRVSFEYIK